MWIQAWEIANADMAEVAPERSGPHHPMLPCPYGVYETADGGSYLLAVARSEDAWDAFCTFAGIPEAVLDERWNTGAKRIGARGTNDGVDEIRELVRQGFASRTTAEWEGFFAEQPQIIYERVQSYEELLGDPMVEANGYLAEVDIPGLGPSRVVSNVVHLSDTPGVGAQGSPPQLGQHTAEVMTELGFGADDIAAVAASTEGAAEQVIGLILDD